MKVLLKKKGFTLVESLVAVGVLMLSIAGPMAIASKALVQTGIARDQIIAFYLGQEGVELIRAIRDTNALEGGATQWDAGIPGFCKTGNGCGIDADTLFERDNSPVPADFVNCNVMSNCRIYYDANGLVMNHSQRGIYEYAPSSGPLTPYTRSILISSVGSGEYTVDVTVSWMSRNISRTLTVQGRIFDQYNAL